jgi:ABC-type sugar transport system ATPase subunit
MIKSDEEGQPTRYDLHVQNLSYTPSKQMLNRDEINRWINWAKLGWLVPSLKQEKLSNFHESFLHRVHFTAHGGELTGIFGSRHERRELVKLLCGQQRSGMFEGNIALSGPNLSISNYYYDYVAYVQTVILYIK